MRQETTLAVDFAFPEVAVAGNVGAHVVEPWPLLQGCAHSSKIVGPMTKLLQFCFVLLFSIVSVSVLQVAPSLTPAYSKMYFVCIWFGFAFSLFWLNRNYHRRVFEEIPDFEAFSGFGISWRALVLLASGFFGGIFSSISGAGIDFCCFSILTLLFRVSEKIATPTSVILIAINTCVGFLYQNFMNGGVHEEAWGFFAVCVPVAVIGAPFGSCVGSHFHRLVLAFMVYIVDVAQFILALIVVKPWLSKAGGGSTDSPVHLTVSSLLLLVSGAVFFKLVEMVGRKLLDLQERKMAEQEARLRRTSMQDVWLRVPEFDTATRDKS